MNKIKCLAITLLLLILVSYMSIMVTPTAFLRYGEPAKATSINSSFDTYNNEHKMAYAKENIYDVLVLSYINLTMPSGQIIRGYQIDFLQDKEINLVLLSSFEEYLKNYFANVQANFNTIICYKVYNSLTDLYIESGYTGYEVPEKSNMIVKNTLLKSSYTSKLDVYSFFNKGTIGEQIVEMASSYYPQKNIRLSYIYGNYLSEKRISSNSIINFYSSAKIYVHQFIYAENTEFNIIQTVPNSTNINLMALAVSAIIIVIIIVTLIVWRKKNDHIS